MESTVRLKLLRGEKVDLDQLEKSNVVRIFISSTFSDMAVERNMLLENAYPVLRKYCQKLGLDFQVMDMRWGIQDAASVEHSICEICLREIQTCKRLSMGPYFVGFVGNRYGYRPIPSNIEFQIFEKLSAIAEANNIPNRALMKEWYRRDDNAVPPCNILQPITNKYPHFDDNNPANANKRKLDQMNWEKDARQLSEVLRLCAQTALNEKEIAEEEAMQFFKSVTEMEIEKGIGEENPDNSIHMYLREITDLKQYLEEPSAPKYMDLKQNAIDQEAQTLLEKLKKEIQTTIDNTEKVKTYEVNWASEQGINSKSKNHMNYLEKFCQDFINDLKSSIDKAVSRSASRKASEAKSDDVNDASPGDVSNVSQSSDWLLEEIFHHALFGQKKCETFCGRKNLIDKVMEQLFSSHSNHPTVVYGLAGRGKTALMAKLVQCCRDKERSSIVAYRFLGTSRHSSHIHNVLQTLILQIAEASGLPVPAIHLLQNYNDLVQRFSTCILEASKCLQKEDKDLVIILDSLDQFSPLDGAHRLKWLPKNIPSNVKILLSTLPDPNLGILARLRKFLPPENFIEVEDLDGEMGNEILRAWLSRAKRDLTQDQHQLVMKGFHLCPNPFFLKLAFDEASTWHSYTDVANLKMASSTKDAISLYFDRLEKIHSNLFVKRSLGYIVASKNGITEGELEDLLSLDNEILDKSYQYWSPPNTKVVRVPSLLWARLRHNLGDDLVERQASGYTVLALYNRLFQETACDRYLGTKDREVVHRNLAEYFLGMWSDGKRKPLKLKIWKNKTINSDRQVASQPNKFSDKVFNTRKLGELSYHLTCARMWEKLNNSVLCNADWLLCKTQAFSVKDLLEDFDCALLKHSDPGITLIRDAIKLAKPTLEFPGGVRNHMCTELYCRLAFFKEIYPVTIGKLVHESARVLESAEERGFLPLIGCFQPPGGPLRTTLTGFRNPISSMISSGDGNLLVAGSADGSIIVWQIGDDEVVYSGRVHEDRVACLALAGTRLVSGSHDNTLQIVNLETDTKVATIQEDHAGYTEHGSVAANESGSVIVSACGNKINVWNVEDLSCKFTLQTSPDALLSCDILLSNEHFLFAGYSDSTAACWNIKNGEKCYSFGNPDNAGSVGAIVSHFVRDRLYYAWHKNGNLLIADTANGEVIKSFQLKAGNAAVLSPGADLFAISHENTVELWHVSLESANYLGTLCHHRKNITVMKFEESKDVLLVGSMDQSISVWPIGRKAFGKMKPLEVIRGMGAPVDFLVSLNDVIASASSKVFYVKLWNRKRKKLVDEPTSFEFDIRNNATTPDGKYLAVFNNFENTLTLQDLSTLHSPKRTGDVIITKENLVGRNKEMSPVLFTGVTFISSSYLILATNDNRLLKVCNQLVQKKTTEKIKSLDLGSPEYPSKAILLLSKNATGEQVLAVTELSETSFQLHIVNTFDMTLECSLLSDSLNIDRKITAACLSNQSAEEYSLFLGTKNNKICVVCAKRRTSSAQEIPAVCQVTQVLNDHHHPVTVISLSADQQHLVTGSLGFTRRLWKKEDDKWNLLKECSFKSLLKAGVTHAAFTNDGKYVVTGSHERSLKVWNVESGKMVAAQYVYATVTGITVTDDMRVITTTKLGYVVINQLNLDQSKSSSRSQVSKRNSSSLNRSLTGKSHGSVRDSAICGIL